jgi:glycerol-1-phosphate dehydrogenase [NAD(P)+]
MVVNRTYPLPDIVYQPLIELNEPREATVVYSLAAWHAIETSLRLRVAARIEVTVAEQDVWETLVPSVRGQVIYAIGGGLATDAVKYFGLRTGLPAVSIPTALSVKAFFTWTAGVREHGQLKYLETGPVERLLIDFDVLAEAPPKLRTSAIAECLSIATAVWDWRFAEQQGQNPPTTAFVDYADSVAQSVLKGALDTAQEVGQGDPTAIKYLIDCLCLQVRLCNQIGHNRPQEGSEHYFAFVAEQVLGRTVPHSELLAPGILMMAALQGQDTSGLRQALEVCHVPLNTLSRAQIEEIIRRLPDYCEAHQVPYGVAYTLRHRDITRIDPLQ